MKFIEIPYSSSRVAPSCSLIFSRQTFRGYLQPKPGSAWSTMCLNLLGTASQLVGCFPHVTKELIISECGEIYDWLLDGKDMIYPEILPEVLTIYLKRFQSETQRDYHWITSWDAFQSYPPEDWWERIRRVALSMFGWKVKCSNQIQDGAPKTAKLPYKWFYGRYNYS